MSSSFSMRLPTTSLTSHVTQRALTDARHHSSQSSPSESPQVHVQMRTPHDPSSFKYSVEDILQIILKNRKSWKTLKGQSEAVWPPYLEATMLKALQEYEPDDSRETRILGRYPMRNRFISDYIHTTTGKYRSAKQVGSRLQQLRDTPEGRELIEILTRCYHTRTNTGISIAQDSASRPASWALSSSPSVSTISCDSSPSSSSASPVLSTTSIMPRFPPTVSRPPAESRMPVYIDILPQQSHWSSMGYGSSSGPTASTTMSNQRPSDAARHIHDIDPTVTFVSPSPVKGKSSYIVLLDGAPVHSEDTALEYVGPYFSSSTGQARGDEPALYNTALVPKYWDVLCKAADPTLYTIVQDVYRVPDSAPNRNYSQRPRPLKIFSAIYHFRYPSSVGPTSYYAQSPVGVSSSTSSTITSTFGDQTLLANPTSFSMPQTYPGTMAHGSAQASAGVDQNLFDEPFMLDVSFDLDDFSINTNTSEGPSSSQYFPPNSFFM